jgi:hypothetical protein
MLQRTIIFVQQPAGQIEKPRSGEMFVENRSFLVKSNPDRGVTPSEF